MCTRALASAFLISGFLNNVSVTFLDKTDPSDPLKCENFWRETLMTMAPYGEKPDDYGALWA